MLNSKIYIAGRNGLVGSSILRELKKKGYKNIITSSRNDLNLLNQQQVSNFFSKIKPDIVILAAAKVGGIYSNQNFPADFIYNNLMIQCNVINFSFVNGVKKLLFLGSSCIYPKFSTQPICEKQLLTGLLEKTNEPYAIAKIAGIKLCESYNRQYEKSHKIDYRCIMPTNLYGPGDNYNEKKSHVIPALIKKFHLAKIKNKKKVIIWGTGSVKRDFLFVDDVARAAIFIMELNKKKLFKNIDPMCSHINVGSGKDLSISDLAKLIKRVVGYNGSVEYDSSKSDGTPRKLLDTKIINQLGWKPQVNLLQGLSITYQNFLKHEI
jgi:GDP-L-fucose synthase